MSETEFDRRLNSSAPATTPPSGLLDQLLQDVAASRVRKRTARWRVGVSTALSLALVGGATAALASPQLQDWFGFTPDRTIPYDGGVAGECVYAFEAHGDHLWDPEALVIAEAALDELELTDTFVQEAVVESRAALTALGPDDPALSLPADQFEARAVSGAVFEVVHEAVEGAGYRTIGLTLSGGDRCVGEPE